MPTSVIDGTVEEAIPGRAKGGVAVFKSIRFQLDNGTSRTVTKAVVTRNVGDEIVPGARGRWYLYTTFDLKGVHGLRTSDGRAVYGFPGTNRKLFLLIMVVSLLWLVLKITVDGEVPLLGVGLFILGIVGWVFMGKGEREAKEQFDGDAGFAAAPPGEAV
jgi:hypothetical protein